MYDGDHSDREQQLDALVRDGQFPEALLILESWYEREPWNGEVLMRLAVVYWLSGQPARTLRSLDAYLAMDPDNAEALARRAQALLMLGKYADAEASLARAAALDPDTPGVLLNRALMAEVHNEYDTAVTALTDYLVRVPFDHLAVARRSHLQRQLGRYAEALADARQCMQMKPDEPEAHFAEALALVSLEQGEHALAACDRALGLQAHFLPALRLKIDLLADLGQVEAAAVVLQALEAAEPQAAQTALLHARLASEAGAYADALTWVNRYMDDYPDEPYGYYRRGMIHFRKGAYAEALADFAEYARLAPRAVEAYEQQFLCYLELGQLPEAIAVSRTALALQPDNYRLQYNLAFAELVEGHTETALEGFHTARRLHPLSEEVLLRIHLALSEYAPLSVRLAWFRAATAEPGVQAPLLRGLLAEALLEGGELAETVWLSTSILDEDATRPYGYLLGIKALCLQERYAEALILADRGVFTLPDDGRLHLARALVLRDMGRPDDALRALDAAAPLLPDDPEVARQRALVYGSTGQVHEAVRLLETALTQGPATADTYFWLGYFQVHRKHYKEALAAAEHLLALQPEAPEGMLVRGVALRGLKRHAEADAVLAEVRRRDPNLLERLRADPVIEALLPAPPSRRPGRWARRNTG
jgi:tetratricopeptide (TPR) repeat protein